MIPPHCLDRFGTEMNQEPAYVQEVIRDTLDLVRQEFSSSEFTSKDKSCVSKVRDQAFV